MKKQIIQSQFSGVQKIGATLRKACLAGFLLALLGFAAKAADLSSTYENNRVCLGGGGFVTGIQFSPYVKDLLFARGDVTGLFKWVPDTVTPAGGHWQQTLDSFGGGERLMYGCYSLAFDPTVHTTVYGAFGESADPYGGSTSPGIYKSTDSGSTWKQIYGTYVAANFNDNNEGERTFGRSLAVDPNNDQVIYYGSQEVVAPYATGGPVLTGGLRVSTDGGNSWSVNASAPWGPPLSASNVYNYSTGIRNVLVDGRQGTVVVNNQTRSKVVYLGIRSNQSSEPAFTGGVFQSIDGGLNYTLMPGSPAFPKDLIPIGTGNKVLITTEDHGVWILQNGTFTNGVATGTDGYGGEINGICVDPFNSNQILGRGTNRFFRSLDGGMTWTPGSSFNTGQTVSNPSDTVVKYSDNVWTYTMSGGSANVALDPFRQGTAWNADCFSVCRTSNVWASSATWNPIVYGLETTVPLWMSCPPAPSGNLLYYGCEDVRGYSWKDLSVYPTQQNPLDTSGQCGTYIRCYNWCESQPQDVVAVYQNPYSNSVFVSTNDGTSWIQQPMPPGTSNGNGAGYLAAISATTPNNMVFAAKSYSGPNPPYYTTNGVSATAGNLVWTASTITIPSGYEIYEGDQYNENICGLTSDTVTGDKFYLDMFGSGNDIVFVSTDGGKTFNVPTGQSIPWSGGASIHASPGIANDLWALTGGGGSLTGGTLYHSTNGGVTWAPFSAAGSFNRVLNYSLGKNAPGSSNPTLFIVGQYNGSYGVFRSNDMGVTFDTISSDANIGVVTGARGYNSPWCMAADRHVYGRVYIGGEGTSVSYLQPAGSGTGGGGTTPPPPTITTQPVNTTATSGQSVTLSVAASGGVTGYQWYFNGTAISGATGASYTIASPTSANAGTYYVVITNANGSTTSNSITLTVNSATTPFFTESFAYPAGNLSGNGGWSGPAGYNVQAAGLSYTDSTGAKLTTGGGSASAFAYYPGSITDSIGQSIGTAGTTVYWSMLYTAGSDDFLGLIDSTGASRASLTTANGTWQIYANGTWNNSGVTAMGAAFLVVRLDFSTTGTRYRLYINPKLSAEASNTAAVDVSDSFTGSISELYWYEAYYTNQALDEIRLGSSWTAVTPSLIAPAITTQPVKQSVTAGSTATFSVVATGTPAPTYQWQKAPSGSTTYTAISGATSASYTTPATTTADNGSSYEVVVTNSAGSVTSSAVALTVTSSVATPYYDGFNYPVGDLNGQGGWTGGAGAIILQAGGLSYTDSVGNSLTTTGSSKVVTEGFYSVATRALGSTFNKANTTSYVSFLAQGGSNSGTIQLIGGGVDKMEIDLAPYLGVYLHTSSSTGQNSATLASGTTNLVVVRMDTDSTGNNVRVRMYINPSLTAEPTTAQVDTGVLTGYGFTYDTVGINGQNYAYASIDELHVGNVYADVTPDAPAASSLSFTDANATSATANLTTLGGTDWREWGLTGTTPIYKSGGGTVVSNYTVLTSGSTVSSYTNNLTPFSWTNGTPTASNTGTKTGIYDAGIGNGFKVTLTSSSTSHTAVVYVGGWNSSGQLTASFANGSATPITSVVASGTGQYFKLYTITYKSPTASPLTVTWKQTAGSGNVTLNAIAVQ